MKFVRIKENVEIDEPNRNYKINSKIVMHRKCEKCGMIGFTDSAHMLSKRLARIIAIRQTKPPETHTEFVLLERLVKRIRGRAGDLRLCLECHECSDSEQEKMVQMLNVGNLLGSSKNVKNAV